MPGGRGGRRNGAVGKAYGNRSDLNGGKVPIAAPTGGEYGSAKASMDAQRAIPVGSPDVAGGPAQTPGPLPDHIPLPGQVTDLFADSQNPDEHVMNGAATGPGAGPEAFGLAPGQAAEQTSAADIARLAAWIPSLDAVANRPFATDTTRQIVRALKSKVSMLPPNVGT